MNNPLISVIIPEKTNLSEECSNSLKLQIFEEFEICSSIDAAKGEYIHFIRQAVYHSRFTKNLHVSNINPIYTYLTALN